MSRGSHSFAVTGLVLTLALTACDSAPEAPEPEPAVSDAPAAEAPPPAGEPPVADTASTPDCTQMRAPALTAEAQAGEKGARNTLLEWASALENGRFERAWCQFREAPVDAAAYAGTWGDFDRLTVQMPTGRMEGAAGTSYDTAPTVILAEKDGRTTRFAGDVVLSRVNDVPGASEEDLLWLIRSAELAESGS